jgi:hypothetical protein
MMTQEQILTATPAVFATSPVAEVTNRYTFIPTSKLLEDFKKLGWYVTRARQQKSSKQSLYVKHMLVLRNPIFPAINGNQPELLIVNSHDRTTAFRFMIALFRFICENGLVVADKVFESIPRIRHIGYDFEDVEQLTTGMAERMPNLIGAITNLSSVQLSKDQQMEFAIRALATRFTEYVDDNKKINEQAIIKAIDVPAILRPLRVEDEGDDVWRVFNRLQERLLKGGFQRIGTKDARSKRVRPITNIKLDVDVNQTLWQMANEYALTA